MVSSISISMNSIPIKGGLERSPQFPPRKLGYYKHRVGRIVRGRSCAGGLEPAHIVDMMQMKEVLWQGESGIEIKTSAAKVLYLLRDTPWCELGKSNCSSALTRGD